MATDAEKPMTEEERWNRFLSWFSLSLLVLQNCSAVLLMRWTQTRKDVRPYSPAAVIVVQELVKIVVCLAAMVRVKVPMSDLLKGEPTKMLVPAVLYAFQNNLLFVALANLEATLFQVTYQTKLLLTALLSVLMLNRRLSMRKWIALVILFAGIILTQVDAKKASRKVDTGAQSLMTGVIAVIACALSSSVASVYFEKVLKNASASLAVRNVQLGFFSLLLGMFVFWMIELREAADFFDGFNTGVGSLVLVQAAGGLIVAAVIKYADNILKGFATAIAIVVSGLFSFMFLDFIPTATFMGGVVLVLGSTGMYSMPDPPVLPSSPR